MKWPFGKRKEEIRADTNIETGEIVESDVLQAYLGRTEMDKEKARQIPAVQMCIDLIAGVVSSLPINLYETQGEGKERKVKEIRGDRRTFLLNNDTGDTLTAAQFWRAMIEDYFLGKGGYAYINWDASGAKSLHYVEEERISILRNTDPIFKDYDILVQGKRYFPHQFFKLLRKTRDGMRSRSIVEESPLLLDTAYNSLKYERALVKKGGNKRGFLQSENALTQPAMEQLKQAFKRFYNNSEENVVVLNKGIRFQESSNTSVEMQLNENKKTNDGEICKLFGIPPAMCEGQCTDKDVDQFIRTCMAVLNDIECSLDRDFLLEDEKGRRYWAFDTKELTRGNIKERYEAYKIGLEKNFLQIDEVREKEDYEPIGFNWITLGLDQVLYNPKTGEIYTPNTDAVKNMGNLRRDFLGNLENRAYKGKNLIITGPPGSGKTTWVHEQMRPEEMVLDLDAIKCALLGNQDMHAQAESLVPVLEAVRDAVRKAIQEGKAPGKCYIITTETDRKILGRWQQETNADLKVMDTPKEVCLQRIREDDSRKDKEIFYELVEEWFRNWEGGE